MTDLPFSAEQTIRTAGQDSGVNVAFMEWDRGELTLVIAADAKIVLRPEMKDL